MHHFFHNLQLRLNATHEAGISTIEEARYVVEQPVQLTEGVDIPQWAMPSLLHDLPNARQPHPK
jgi:hypothetical protein